MSQAQLARLNEQRQIVAARSAAILDKADAEKRGLTPAEATSFDADAAELKTIAERSKSITEAEQRNAAMDDVYRSVVGNGGQPVKSWLPSRREYAGMVEDQRALGYSNAGVVLPTDTYSQWFDRLRAKSVVLAAGPRLLPVPHHALAVPVLTGSVTVGNYAENTSITASDPTLAGPTLTPIKFAALVLASNEALGDSSPALRDILVTDLINQTATAVDTEFLVGPGSANRIRGLKNVTGATVVSAPTNGSVPTLDTVLDLISSLEGIGSDLDNIAIFMTPAIWSVLRKIKATTGGTYLVQPDPTSPARPSLFGAKVFATNNLPQTETQGTATGITSTIIAADMSRIAVGVGKDVSVQVSEDFAFDKDQSAVRVTGRFDLAALNANAVALAVGNKTS